MSVEVTDLDGIEVRRDARLKPQTSYLPAMQSEYTDLLTAAKCKARPEFNAIRKNAKGNFGPYATLDEVIDSVVGALCKYGLDLDSQTIVIGDQEWLITTLTHTSGQYKRAMSVIRANPAKPQDYLSWVTYYRRCHNAALCGVAADSDNDGEGLKGAGDKRGPNPVNLAAQAIRSATSTKDRDAALARAALSVAAGRITEEEFESLTALRDSLNAKPQEKASA
jgi:hypothetical protein